MSISNAFTNAKVIFLTAFVFIFLAWTWYDYRHGNSMVGPLIFGVFLAIIAIVFKPWRQGSDEQRPPTKRDPFV